MGLLEDVEGPVAAGLEQRLPCSEICIIGKCVGWVVGREGLGERRGGYGSLGVIRDLTTVYKDLFLQMYILAAFAIF